MGLDTEIKELREWKAEIAKEEESLIQKAIMSNDPYAVVAASTAMNDIEKKKDSGLKSWFIDPNNTGQDNGYLQKRIGINYLTLRKMSRQPIIRAIIGTRQTQISAFSAPQKNKYDTGFVIRKKQEFYSQDEVKYSKKEKARRIELTNMILNCGSASQKWHGDNFDEFLRKLVEDSMTLDQATFEVVRDRKGDPVKFMAIDGGTIRVADTIDDDMGNTAMHKHKIKGYLPSYVQVLDGTVRSIYYPWEMCFGIRNVTTDIRTNGYGRSELEDLISIVTYMLYSDKYNGNFFSNGSSPKGIFKAKSGINRNRLMEFRQQWLAMMSGVENAWKMPVIEGDMEYVDLQMKNSDMQFTEWQKYLIKVACAVYKISPEECGFDADGAGGGITFESNNEAKLQYSKDKGLKPMLKAIEFWINRWFVEPLDDNFEFAFVGIDADTQEKELDLLVKKVENGMGYKEFREALGLERDLAEDDFPLNSVYIQKMGQDQMQQAQEGGAFDDMAEDGQEFDWDAIDENVDDVIKGHEGNPMMADIFKLGVR